MTDAGGCHEMNLEEKLHEDYFLPALGLDAVDAVAAGFGGGADKKTVLLTVIMALISSTSPFFFIVKFILTNQV